MSFLLGSVLALLSATAYTTTIGPTARLVIENKSIAPDGFRRSAVLAGSYPGHSSFPGPVIVGNKGDTFNLNVVNNLTDDTMLKDTTIHWHGLFQNKTAWADGPEGVTQCPIVAGNSFTYQFSGLSQAGTFWYHSHYSSQYCDGLRGVMVIYDPNDPYKNEYDYDNETTILTLADWYHTVAPELSKPMARAIPDSTLINGLGRFPGNTTAPLAVVSVVKNKRYRMRLVSLSCDSNFVFSIDDHLLDIIEVDGNNVQHLTVESIQIFAGQRYSFILNANKNPGNYWIRANPNVGNTGFENGINSAILRYIDNNVPVVEPTTKFSNRTLLKETDLSPRDNTLVPGPDVPAHLSNGQVIGIELNISFNGTRFFFNDETFVPPPVPVLASIISGARRPEEILPDGTFIKLPPNKVIELNIPGGGLTAPHPIHLHGHAFSVVRSANSSRYNYNNPVIRDVVNAGSSDKDNVTIRFVTDNTGPWILHCHIDWHLDKGLAIVFAEDIEGIAKMDPPQPWDDLCKIFDETHPHVNSTIGM